LMLERRMRRTLGDSLILIHKIAQVV
jgi:hypothetical protein